MQTIDTVAILDFGSQYTQLIARRLRELGVYTQILAPDTPGAQLLSGNFKGIILSGGPHSVSPSALSCDPELLQSELPILGICYGMQLMNTLQQGTVKPWKQGEYGKQMISLKMPSALFEGLGPRQNVWMSHGDSVETLASCYRTVALSQSGHIAAICHQTKPHYGVQFHPEVSHTENGKELLDNFVRICRCAKNWSIDNFIERATNEIRAKVGGGKVVSLVSGGVDSTAATFLCFAALGADKVYPLHIDTGLMRQGESREVCSLLKEHGMHHLKHVDASGEFLHKLKGVVDPEMKRKIIGEHFIQILEREMQKLDLLPGTTYFCQGTLYTDLIESGKGCGKHAKVIKSHHNVNPPIVQKKREQGLIIEPNATIFKDEVRQVCAALGIPRKLTLRHPFPGPGLAIRIIGEVTPERVKTLQQADRIMIEEIEKGGYYDKVWQAFAVLLPIATVGVMGDNRTYGSVIALRAIDSVDGMTADVSPLPLELLGKISTRITNEVPHINRVVYDITSKPPATIEWE